MSPFQDLNSCEQSEITCAYALQALPASEAAAAEAHIASCPDCQRELESLRPVVDRFVSWPTDVLRPTTSLQGRLARRIADETGKQPELLPGRQWSEPDWEQVAPGIECKLLAADAERHLVSMLVRLAPGTSYPPHTHAGVEELHLLDGELWINGRKLVPGDYNYGAPGALDESVWSETGCTCVLITSTEDTLRRPRQVLSPPHIADCRRSSSSPLGWAPSIRSRNEQPSEASMTSIHPAEANCGSNSFVALASLDQAVLDALPEAIYLCAKDGTVLRFNRKAVELWGRTPTAGDPRERYCGSVQLYRTDGTPMPHDQCPMAVALQTGESFHNQEVVMAQPDGQRHTVLVNIAALRDNEGRVNGAINCFKDITDHKRTEAALRLSERRFREMIDAMPAAIYTTDAEGRITHFNPAAAEFAGRVPKLGTDEWCVTWKLFYPDGTPMPHDQCPMAIALKEGRAVRGAEAIAERPDGTRVSFIPYPTPLRDDWGRIVGAVNMLVDISERKRVEQERGQLAAIVQSSDDAIVGKDLNGIIQSWNAGAERLFGYSPDEVIGKPVTILIPPDRHDEEPGILARIRRGDRVEHYETVRQRKDGSLIDISLSVSPIADADGRVIGASKIARDISERRRAQAHQELLTHEIHHRTRNLFAVVQAVVARSFAGKQSVEEAELAVRSRLESLAQTHVILMDNEWEGADLREVIAGEMSPYAGRVKVEGPRLMLKPKAAQNFALALHELATNAAKYGALSNATGWVEISWSVGPHNGVRAFSFRWQEHGGPPVSVPERRGFGSTVLEVVMAEYVTEPPRINLARSGLSYALAGSVEAIATAERAAQGGKDGESSQGLGRPLIC